MNIDDLNIHPSFEHVSYESEAGYRYTNFLFNPVGYEVTSYFEIEYDQQSNEWNIMIDLSYWQTVGEDDAKSALKDPEAYLMATLL